jgi:hypothetical protein
VGVRTGRGEGVGGVGRKRENTLLSVQMRDSWATGRFWFDYGTRKRFDIDAVYWSALHKEGDDVLSD